VLPSGKGRPRNGPGYEVLPIGGVSGLRHPRIFRKGSREWTANQSSVPAVSLNTSRTGVGSLIATSRGLSVFETTRGRNVYICQTCSVQRGLSFVGAFANSTGTKACYFCRNNHGNFDLTSPPPYSKKPRDKSLEGILVGFLPPEEVTQVAFMLVM
jgi:hypothetical protein